MSKSWASTLKLPVTKFGARPTQDNALRKAILQRCTGELYKWQAETRAEQQPFILHDGPPYANGPLHTGHAVNKILKDMIVRNKIQSGEHVVWRPGWDCHGLPIELKAIGDKSIAHHLEKNTIVRNDAQYIIPKAKELATKTVQKQMEGFKSFGVLADWENKWKTMDSSFVVNQLMVFKELVKKGLVYRRKKPVWWSTKMGTALAEAELEYKDDHKSKSAYVKFRIISDLSGVPELQKLEVPLYAAIWTTTPWTLPGNKAIAVHNELDYMVVQVGDHALLMASDRWGELSELLGEEAKVIVPRLPGSLLVGMKYTSKVMEDGEGPRSIMHGDFVSADSGTGLVHCAPGHGHDDYALCLRHGIEATPVVDEGGRYTGAGLPLSLFDSIQDTMKDSKAPLPWGYENLILKAFSGDILKTKTIKHRYPYDWRTRQPVLIRATWQWFVDISSIKEDAVKALENVKFIPESGKARLESFVKGRSEWCISRQRCWGVPIPVLYDQSAEGAPVMTEEVIDHIAKRISQHGVEDWFKGQPTDNTNWAPESIAMPTTRKFEIMDVWFDSGTSWKETETQADVYLEGTDQYRGWFQSSLLTHVATQTPSREGGAPVAPFKTVITHGFTLDKDGKKMSKSLGNTILPEDIMNGTLLPKIKRKGKGEAFHDGLGADALRLFVASSDFRSDMQVGPDMLKPVHSSLNKYRSIIKMLLGSLHESARTAPLTAVDGVALHKLHETIPQVHEAFDRHEFYRAVSLINNWVSVELSAFYLEARKDRLYCGDGGGVVEQMFVGLLQMLAPVTPFLVEEAWHYRPQWMVNDSSLVHPARNRSTPQVEPSRLPGNMDTVLEMWPRVIQMRKTVQSLLEQARSGGHIGNSLEASVEIFTSSRDTQLLAALEDTLTDVFVVSEVKCHWLSESFDKDICDTKDTNMFPKISSVIPGSESWTWTEEHLIRDYIVEDSDTVGSDSESQPLAILVRPAQGKKCDRCWKHIAKEENSICDRCQQMVRA